MEDGMLLLIIILLLLIFGLPGGYYGYRRGYYGGRHYGFGLVGLLILLAVLWLLFGGGFGPHHY
jgi:hypothetical protein